MESKEKKISKQNRKKLMGAENRLTVARGRGIGRLGEKVKGLRSTDWCLQNGHRDVKYSVGSTVVIL